MDIKGGTYRVLCQEQISREHIKQQRSEKEAKKAKKKRNERDDSLT
jgi:hypothetical protein